MSESLRFTDENFKREVLDGELPVFVDFWGSWCPPCKMVEPVVEELAAEFAGKVKIGKLNVDRNPAVRSEFQIKAAPTFILFRNGKILKRAIGSHSKKQLLKIIQDSVDSLESVQAKSADTSDTCQKQQPTDVLEEV